MSRLRMKPLDYAAVGAFLAYSSSAVLTPVALVLIVREMSLSLSEGSAIEVVRSVLIVAVLTTSGFLAAHWGKAKSLGAGLMLLGAGLVGYAVAPGYAALLAAAVAMGAGAGVVEGLVNPLIQDLHPSDSGRYLNISNGFWSIGVLVTVLATGDLLTRGVSWRWVALVLGAFGVAAGIGFVILRRVTPRPAHCVRDVFAHKRDILTCRRFWLFAPMMVLAGAAEGAFTFWSASFIQLQHNGLPRDGGIGTAFFAGGMVVGRFASGYRVAQRHLWRLLIGSAGAGLAVSLLVPLAGTMGAVYAALGAAGLAVACFWPSLQSYAADRLPVEPTSLFILLSCAGIPGFALASWVMGVIGDAAGLAMSFWIVPGFFAGLVVLLAVERCTMTPNRHRKERHEQAGHQL